MINAIFGKLRTTLDDVNYSVTLRFISEFDDQDLILTTLDEINLKRLINELNDHLKEIKKIKEKRKEIIEHTNFNEIYDEMDLKYNPCPFQMTYATAFDHALHDGIINEETYWAAQEYYGDLWTYGGD